MKFAILGAWPVGQFLLDQDYVLHNNAGSPSTGTIVIDTSQPQWAFLLTTALAGGNVPPTNAQALDQATYNAMVSKYGRRPVLYGAGVVPA